MDALETIHDLYRDRVAFFVVYLREAHTEDGRQSAANLRDNLLVLQPQEYDDRVALAQEMCSTLELSIPCLIDGMDDRVATTYAAMPDRLYVVGLDGTIAYKGERGPKGFRPEELAEFLDFYLLLLDAVGDAIRPLEAP